MILNSLIPTSAIFSPVVSSDHAFVSDWNSTFQAAFFSSVISLFVTGRSEVGMIWFLCASGLLRRAVGERGAASPLYKYL